MRAMRSALSMTHFCARLRTLARPSKPSASQPGCARARALDHAAATSSGLSAGTEAITSPVAGFCTSMVLDGWPLPGALAMSVLAAVSVMPKP